MSDAVRSSDAMCRWRDLGPAERASYLRCLSTTPHGHSFGMLDVKSAAKLPGWATSRISDFINAVLVEVVDAGEAADLVADPRFRYEDNWANAPVFRNLEYLYDASRASRALAALMGLRSLPGDVRRTILTAQAGIKTSGASSHSLSNSRRDDHPRALLHMQSPAGRQVAILRAQVPRD